MADRTYLPISDGKLDLNNIGTNLKVAGLIMQGEGDRTVFFWLPSTQPLTSAAHMTPSDSEWGQIIQQSDDPRFFRPHPIPALPHILVRKVEYEISGVIQQRVWHDASYCCQYCGREMGVGGVQLTVDHFVPLSLGGANDMSNYLSACKRCNKLKGDTPPEEFCREHGYDYHAAVLWLKQRR